MGRIPVLILLGLLTGCRFDGAGVGFADAARPIATGGPGGDAGLIFPDSATADGVSTVDTSPDTTTDLGPSPQEGLAKNSGTIVIDGQLSDWVFPPESTWLLDESTAATVLKEPAFSGQIDISAIFAVQWTTSALLVAVRVTDPSPEGTNATLWRNSSVEVYVDGDGVLEGNYGSADHQYVADYRGGLQEYGPSYPNGTTSISPVQGAVLRTEEGYDVELSIAAKVLGPSGLEANREVGLDVAVNQGSGNKRGVLLWSHSTEVLCVCGFCPDLPYCNTRHFRTLTLLP